MIWFYRASDFSRQIRTVAIASAIDVTSRTFDDLYQSYTWQPSCVHEHNGHALCIVGTVDRRGYGGQQKGTICDARGPYPSI